VDKRPLRVGLVFLSAAVALAMLLTGCGGSDDRAKVEASLRHYLIHPHACINYRFCPQGAFPLGAGAPQVKENSCKKIHTRTARLPEGLSEGLSGWSCVITFPPGRRHCLWPSLRRTTAKSPGRRRRRGTSRFHHQPSTREARSSHGLSFRRALDTKTARHDSSSSTAPFHARGHPPHSSRSAEARIAGQLRRLKARMRSPFSSSSPVGTKPMSL
jgi:hypothetical protein